MTVHELIQWLAIHDPAAEVEITATWHFADPEGSPGRRHSESFAITCVSGDDVDPQRTTPVITVEISALVEEVAAA